MIKKINNTVPWTHVVSGLNGDAKKLRKKNNSETA